MDIQNRSRRRFAKSLLFSSLALPFASKLYGSTKTSIPKTNRTKTLRVLASNPFATDSALAKFYSDTGFNVEIEKLHLNEVLEDKLAAPDANYDLVIVPSRKLRALLVNRMLLKLDYSGINNQSKNAAVVVNSIDAEQSYAIPYSWNTIGMAFSKGQTSKSYSWAELYHSSVHTGKLALMNSPRILIGIGLKYMGLSVNNNKPANINAVEKLLIDQKRHIATFHKLSSIELFSDNRINCSQEFSAAMASAAEFSPKIHFSIPVEGSIITVDNLAIPSRAKNPDAAHKFINHLLDFNISSEIFSQLYSAPFDLKVYDQMTKTTKTNAIVFPSLSQLNRCEIADDLGTAHTKRIRQAYTNIMQA